MFDRWCSAKIVDRDYEKLRQILLTKDFKGCINDDVRTFIKAKDADVCTMANTYTVTY